jgi:peptide deformylase
MTIRPIHIIPDDVLRAPTEPVGAITPEIRTLVEDMFETMYAASGIGLAAPQVGVKRRIAVVDVSARDDEKVPLIDPEITWRSEETSLYDEGCLSIPDYYAEVERPSQVRVRYRDLDGVEQEIEAEGVLSTCIQHEIDHLDGVLFIDMISKLKRDMVWKRFAKQAKRDGGAKPWLPKKRQPRELHEPENSAALPAGEL